MQWIGKAVQYYKDINPATLTGAIDVIVVERPLEGGEVELACSPFHVRFGKLSVLRPIDKKVRITVNDEKIPFYMKVGETGEAFFVFETDADVPEDLQTSPLSGALLDDDIAGINGGDAPGEPEFLDLGESADPRINSDLNYDPDKSGLSSPNSSRYQSLTHTQPTSPIQTRQSLPGIPSNIEGDSKAELAIADNDNVEEDEDRVNNADGHSEAERKSAAYVPAGVARAAEKIAGLGTAAFASVSGGPELKQAVKRSDRQGTRDHQESEDVGVKGRKQVEVGQIHGGIQGDLEGLALNKDESHKATNQTGEEVRASARDRNADVREILGGDDDAFSTGKAVGAAVGADGVNVDPNFDLNGFKGVQHHAEEQKLFNMNSEVGAPAPEMSGDLMLDMSGYKIGGEAGSKDNTQGDLLNNAQDSSTHEGFDEKAQEQMVAFTQGLLQSTDPKTLREYFDPSNEEEFTTGSSRPTSPVPDKLANDSESSSSIPADKGSVKSSQTARSRASSRATSPNRALSITSLQTLAETDTESSKNDGVFHASPKQFTLKVGGRVHVFELSLCGDVEFGANEIADEKAFQDSQVTFSQFMEHDDLIDHSNLVVKYAGQYLTWENASPVLASLAVYRKSLIDHPEHHRHVDQSEIESRRSSKGWSLWWSRKGGTTSTVSLPTQDSSPPISPPVSPPVSPRSLPLPNQMAALSPPTGPVDNDIDTSRHYAKTLRLTSEQLKTLGLKKGMNEISFSVRSSYSGFAMCTSRIFLWESDFQVVISDIDGTITKSDALGHVFTMIGRDWTHLGVAKLYTDVARNGYKMMYLTSRAIGQADTTREYLKGIRQNEFKLPDGPVIMSPDRLMTSLHREVIMRKPELFKMACLRDIQRLFGERSPFYAGFGNRITDALSYRSVDIPSSRIFTIDTNGEVKMELLDLAGYKSSYIHMTDLVDQMFPPINRTTAPDYTDFNFWRSPMTQFDLPDLSPPSPALSARSDSSRIGFPRLGNLASSLSRRSSRQTLQEGGGPPRSHRTGTPSSPLLNATLVEEPVSGDFDDETRSESESMPGSLPNDSDFSGLRAVAEARNGQKNLSDAQKYKEAVKAARETDDVEEDEEEEEQNGGEDGEGDEFGDQLDFSSVPYL